MLPERPQQHSREVPHQMHPKLSSQNTWHPPVTLPEPPKTWFNPLGPSHHRPWGGVTQYYRHQLLDASLPLCPPPDRPRGANHLQGSRLRQAREEKSITVISLVSLPDVAFVGAERFPSISLAARMGGMLGDPWVGGKCGAHGPYKHNPRA